MISLKEEFKARGFSGAREYFENMLIERGLVYSDIFGWEKPEVLESFGLNPNMAGVPCEYVDAVDEKTVWVDERDNFGNKTGRKVAKFEQKLSGKTRLVISRKFLEYLNYCDQKRPDGQKSYPLRGISRE